MAYLHLSLQGGAAVRGALPLFHRTRQRPEIAALRLVASEGGFEAADGLAERVHLGNELLQLFGTAWGEGSRGYMGGRDPI